MKSIVAGVDGSAGSQAAVEFAAREAAAHGASLRLLAAWEVPPSVMSSGGVPPDMYSLFEGEAGRHLDEALALVKEVAPQVVVEAHAAEGHAGNLLVEESHTADLIVIGRRGHSGLTEFLLGSISHQVADHAACSVVIVPPPAAAAH